MAKRPVFSISKDGATLLEIHEVEFQWHAGMAMSQRQKSMRSLHSAISDVWPDRRILEVSRMSDNPIGTELSAFNLMLMLPDIGNVPLECAFQASKVFECGGPYVELLHVSPADAKRDPRLKNSGRLVRFHLFNHDWPLEPPTAFYDWIYIRALYRTPRLAEAVQAFDTFTDIAFNPEKSINCQARAVALFVALSKRGILEDALGSFKKFVAYETNAERTFSDQPKLF